MTSLPKAASSQTLILTLDLVGTAVFALEGAGAGAESRLDLLGVLVIAFVTALGGGITRDILIGATPPRAFADWRYPVVAFAAGIAAFLLSEWVRVFPGGLLIVLDAAGLTLFAIAGAEKALEAGLGAVPAILIAGVTAVGDHGGGAPPGPFKRLRGHAGGGVLLRPSHDRGSLRLAVAQGRLAVAAHIHRRRLCSAYPPIGEAGDKRADERGRPEQPQLLNRPTLFEHRRSQASGGIH